jgi:non-ribosomal peptide synthetase component F
VERLGGAPTDVWLPHDRPRRETQSTVGAAATTRLPAPLASRIREVLGQVGCTTFMAGAALLAVVLARRSPQRDFLFAFPWSGREAPGSADAVAMLVNTLILRIDLRGDPTWRELMLRVRDASVASYRHAGVPFDGVAGALHPGRDLSRPALTPVFVTAEKDGLRTPDLGPGIRLRYLRIDHPRVKYELELTALERRRDILFKLEYAADLFDARTANRLLADMAAAARSLAAAPDSPAVANSERAALVAAP